MSNVEKAKFKGMCKLKDTTCLLSYLTRPSLILAKMDQYLLLLKQDSQLSNFTDLVLSQAQSAELA